ncbi:MAG TPA: DsbA family oxidoreductase [Cytophagales bacterium]|nr:DsbA family oxidoreductase [Cytophagales bacterium]
MKVNIWSDIRCPFCYTGKHKFEAALEKFPHKDKVEVVWHSFELDPNLKTRTDISINDYLAEIKGVSTDHAEQMNNHVTQVASEIGLDFNIEKSIVANSFNAHRIIQLAKAKGLGSEAEEQMFKAHFTDGKNIDDKETLVQIAISIGLNEKEAKEVLASNAYAEEVKKDEHKAHSIGVRGVPFFVFNDKYAVSGAQAPDTFLQALEKSWEEFEKENKSNPIILNEGDSCSIDGNC